MLGEAIAATDAAECTRVVTWYSLGPLPRRGSWPRWSPAALPFRRGERGLDVDLGGPAAEVERLEVSLPNGRLREQSLIDTPGLASASAEVSARSVAALTEESRPATADAVLYLLRHLHGHDVRFLESFHGSDLAIGSPVNAVGVLSGPTRSACAG